MGVTDRPLLIPTTTRSRSRPFQSFFEGILTAVLAFVLAWRVLISSRRGRNLNSRNTSDEATMESGPSSVLFLLTTDNIPESSSSGGEERPPPPMPTLLQPALPTFLDTINEEESDDLRSASSSSFASPRTVIDRSVSTERVDNVNRSISSRISDSDYQSPEAQSPQQVDSADTQSTDVLDSTVELHEVTVIERNGAHSQIKDDIIKRENTQGLLKELARLGQSNQIRFVIDSKGRITPPEEKSVISPTAAGMSSQRILDIPMMDEQLDADRDQEEELVYNEQRRTTVTMDDSLSLNSVSINLNTTKDNLLDQSITSDPTTEERSVMENILLKDVIRPSVRPPSPPLDLPPPPPQLTSPISTTASPSKAFITLNRMAEVPDLRPPPVPPPPPPPSTLFTIDNKRGFIPYDRSDQGMSSPPNEPPPPIEQSLPAPPYISGGSKSGFSSHEDLLSEQAHSRSTVREIPVLRTPSAAPSQQSTVLDFRMPTATSNYPLSDVQDEYYRREVMTRTVITRSTEALSQQPPLGRSSPIERYITYPDPNTREERTFDYKITYHRNVEDEERRIREDQDRRRKEEEDRRRREEENRRAWELREREVLEHLRLEREKKEKEFELSILERERAEKERIERDRLDRERIEMQRRAEWERMENERRGLEESDLARKRQLEKERLEIERAEEERKERERLERERERLERERIEAERREQERLEKIRIERERIERERIEVERIERIKREKIERERREREREREEQERLQREREELERIERERRELEIREREMLELQRREAEERERQRIEDEAKEVRRREEERREAELLADIQRQAEERERLRRLQEREEHERLERIRREQQRVDLERAEAERRERERLEEERREKELLDAQRRKKEQRERERLEDQERERLRQEEERKERERRELERRAAAERERQRKEEEERERLRIYELERAAATRRAQRQAELERERERDELDKKAREVAEMERREAERRERERLEEERSLSELREKERRNQEIREKERIEAAEREAARRLEDRRSRDKLDYIVRERTERERLESKFEAEKRRLLTEKESMNKKRHHLTSSETLQKLTRPPYFSRENLNTEVTTKVERQVIERVDRNVWVDEMRYPSSAQQAISYSLDSTNDENTRDRIYNPRDNDLARNGSTRTSRYRAKMEKARRDFITGTQESTDPLTERFRKSTEDLLVRGRPEYRGPLLQKFHDGEFKSKTDLDILPYSRVGPSQYGQEFERLLEETERKYAAYRMRMSQPNLYSRSRHWSTSYLETDVDTGRPEMASCTREVEETNLDDVYRRSGSVVDYHRQSRRDQTEDNPEPIHTRSRSADYLMDRKTREESEPPENQLQKTMGEASPRNSRISEHELRFRKSTEKLTVPDWYRENRPTVRPTDVDLSLPRGTSYANASSSQYGTATIKATPHRPESPHSQQSHHRYSQPFSYTSGPHNSATQSSPGGFDIPRGMFDRYKDEIENLRKSRTSLHHLGQEQRQEERPSPAPRRSLSHEAITTTRTEATSNRALPGYTVSEVPNAWNVRRSRSSRVVEVADTFVGPKQVIDQYGNVSLRYGGRVTIEEVLDSIFQQTSPTSGPDGTNSSGLPMADNVFSGNINGPGIYTKNYMLMDQVIKQPERAGTLLKSEDLFVRCAYCHKTKEISQARMQFVTCKHCYTYYCKRECRSKDWIKHGCRCSFARINTLCKDVIMKVREDQQAQTFMSRIAREGFSASGRGSVNIRLSSPQLAQAYVTHGWIALANAPLQELLHYYTIASLLQERKEPSLIALCKRYDPREKFILSVSIIADIEHCPQTPPPETVDYHQETQDHGYNPQNQNQSPNQIHFAGQRYPPYMPLTLIPTDV